MITSLTICHPSLLLINARSLKKKNGVSRMLSNLARIKPDICLVTETWLTTDKNNETINIANYKLFGERPEL